MAARFQRLTVAGPRRTTADAVIMTFDAPPAFRSLNPGQYLTLRVAIYQTVTKSGRFRWITHGTQCDRCVTPRIPWKSEGTHETVACCGVGGRLLGQNLSTILAWWLTS